MRVLWTFCKFILNLLALCIGPLILLLLFKGVQTLCWRNDISFPWSPSLESFDPLERYEAARHAAKKYGGEK